MERGIVELSNIRFIPKQINIDKLLDNDVERKFWMAVVASILIG